MRLTIFRDGKLSPPSVFLLISLLLFTATVIASVFFTNSSNSYDRILKGNKQNLIHWEISNFFNKWIHLSTTLFRHELSESEKQVKIVKFFELVGLQHSEKSKLEYLIAQNSDQDEILHIGEEIERIQGQIISITPLVEELLEAKVSKVLSENNIIDEWGPVHWPPVDFTFEPGGLLLMTSPVERIFRQREFLLQPNLSLLEQISIENHIEEAHPDTSALVIRIGGVATYPAQIRNTSSLHGALNLISHEWLHHWLIFRPLGKKWFEGGELRTINETVANIFAEEIGDETYLLITGQKIIREPWTPATQRSQIIVSDQFDYKAEMRRTRQKLEALLSVGSVEDSQIYLEDRRRFFVNQGYNIRKLNNAWFAFYGSYADSGGSISPIESQLRFIRLQSIDLRDFLSKVKQIDEVGQLEKIAMGLGWTAEQLHSYH